MAEDLTIEKELLRTLLGPSDAAPHHNEEQVLWWRTRPFMAVVRGQQWRDRDRIFAAGYTSGGESGDGWSFAWDNGNNRMVIPIWPPCSFGRLVEYLSDPGFRQNNSLPPLDPSGCTAPSSNSQTAIRDSETDHESTTRPE